jgi:hypothetical protein
MTKRELALRDRISKIEYRLDRVPFDVRNIIDRDEKEFAMRALSRLPAIERVECAERLLEHTSFKAVGR